MPVLRVYWHLAWPRLCMPKHWRLATSFPNSLDTIYGAAEIFARHVKIVSGGNFEVSVHAAGELMPAFGVVDAVQQGAIEAAHTAPYYFYAAQHSRWRDLPVA